MSQSTRVHQGESAKHSKDLTAVAAPISSQIGKSDPAVRKTFAELFLHSVFAKINKVQKFTPE